MRFGVGTRTRREQTRDGFRWRFVNERSHREEHEARVHEQGDGEEDEGPGEPSALSEGGWEREHHRPDRRHGERERGGGQRAYPYDDNDGRREEASTRVPTQRMPTGHVR